MNDQQHHEVIVIGAGPGGICTSIKLIEAGITDFVVLERAGGLGGTWWNNRYPGAECDVPSHLYSFSFEPKRDWSRPYARQPEILAYMRGVVDKYQIAPYVRLGAEVVEARWQDDENRWQLLLGDGTLMTSRFLISGVGMFTKLNYPDVPGIDTFAGTAFHTGDWKDGHDLSGERVAVIGSAASAVQMIPEIVDNVAHLTVYQRRPQWVLPKADDPFTEEQIHRFVTDDEAAAAQRNEIREGLEGFITFSNKPALKLAEDRGRENLEVVTDPDVRARMTPSMDFGCRRPLSSNLYYPVFNLENVTLVSDGVDAITETGVTAAGETTEVDTIIYATGFQTTRYLSCIDVYGRDGLSIHDAWADGAQAHLGTTTSGFPNLFMLYGPNTNNGSILEMIEHQVEFAITQIAYLNGTGDTWLEVTPDTQATYNTALQQDLAAVDVWQGNCGGYYRARGGFIVTQWPHTMDEYKTRLANVPASQVFRTGS
jgi:cyclohexanone monooxygenase